MEDNYKKQQDEWLKHSGVKVGDTVLCISIATGNHCGWNQSWVSEMRVGDSGRVLEIHPRHGVAVYRPNGIRQSGYDSCWWYPFFVLVKED